VSGAGRSGDASIAVSSRTLSDVVTQGELLWTPDDARRNASRMAQFARWSGARRDRDFDSYDVLWRWSVGNLEEFWGDFVAWSQVPWTTHPTKVINDRVMPGAKWFPGGRLNFAEALLYPCAGGYPDDIALVATAEDVADREVTWAELRDHVAAVRGWLLSRGVVQGDRVVAVLPNGLEAVVALLAATSIGAVWSCCSPDFGASAVADRFAQIEPVILFTVSGYQYGGSHFDVRERIAALRELLPSLRETVVVTGPRSGDSLDGTTPWREVIAATPHDDVASLPFDAPLWILYSSGTTGLPKPIIHSHGGILVEQMKQMSLHFDLGPGDRFLWFVSTGWMVWNALVCGLAVGATIVLYDGNPAYPEPGALWRLAERVKLTGIGTSPPYLQACQRAGLRPGRDLDLSRLRTVVATGSPLLPESYAWVYDEVSPNVLLASPSGGTDVCSAFVGGSPLLPVHAGEIACPALGVAVAAFDEDGQPVVGRVGELVITEPMPSMPIGFWGDEDGSRLREAYFETYPGVWRHGDWITITERGSCIISGRSDSTLNRDGVRMGTSEFYRVVETMAGITDSLVIDTSAAGLEGQLLLFVVLDEDLVLHDVTIELRQRIRSELSPRHVPDEIIAIDVVPRTLTGKKCEVPVKRVLAGTPLTKAVAPGALQDANAMLPFVQLAATIDRRASASIGSL
jgi:acetoacetyl-CoA synthetase